MKVFWTLLLTLSFFNLSAQKKKNTEITNAKDAQNSLASFSMKEGFIPFAYDASQDKVFLYINKWDSEFLYISALATGVGSNDIGLDRGQLGVEHVVKFERKGPKVFLTEVNYRYRAETANPDEKRAVNESFAQSVLWGFKVESEENGTVKVDATDFFLRDAHGVIDRLRTSQQGNYTVDKTRSALYPERMKNFPKNTEIEVTLTFTGQANGSFIRSVTPTPDAITVRQHHSFIELPDDNYKLRAFDPRAGYFGITYFDYATPINQPIEKRFISRHRLEKKDPNAERSEAVEPIVYYLDRGAPEPIRSALLEGARWWNEAFEAAGFVNAFRVELMPEGVDPLDVRYNVIQWVHRSTRGWSYGASVSDPRTGEILKGHVSLGSLRVRQDFLIAEGLLSPYEKDNAPNPQMEQMALARLRQLSAHEVGHTLGLAHAYSSSSERNASVMDYPHPMVRLVNNGIDLSQAYSTGIGEWDKVAISYGYKQYPPNMDEKKALDELLMKSITSGLTFLSDQDARPVGGAHPYAHLWDNGKDAVDELNNVMQIRRLALNRFGENNIPDGRPLANLEEVFVPVYFFHRYQTEAAAKLIGGLNYRYAIKGDNQFAAEIVSPEIQRRGIDMLLKTISPEELVIGDRILKLIPPRPLGFERHREVIRIHTSLTFDPLAAAEAAANLTLDLMLHPARAARMVEYHSRDASNPSFEFMMEQLLSKTIKAPWRKGLERSVQETVNLVVLNGLIRLARAEEASPSVRAKTFYTLDQLRVWCEQKSASPDEALRAHYAYIAAQIELFEDDMHEFEPAEPLQAPPGQPIGHSCPYDE